MGEIVNKDEIDKYVKDLEEGIKPTLVFNKADQYGDYHTLTDDGDETFEVSKSLLMRQVEKFIPEKLRHLVVWIKHHWEARSVKVEDNNYEMFGLTKDKIGTTIVIPEHWTIGWKYTPEAKS